MREGIERGCRECTAVKKDVMPNTFAKKSLEKKIQLTVKDIRGDV